MTNLYLKHHGIKGQKWGVRNGPPYPLNSKSKSTRKKAGGGTESSKEKGKAACNKVLSQSGKHQIYAEQLDKSVEIGKNKVNEVIHNSGSNYSSRRDSLPKDSKLYVILDDRNPTGSRDNCKDLAVANACYNYGHNVMAGENTYEGNLGAMFEDKFGMYDKVKFMTPHSSNGREIKQQLENNILRNAEEGDIGAVDITYSELYKKRVKELTGIELGDGHAFNWMVENDQVIFGCSQDGYPKDESQIFDYVDASKQIEYVKITEDMANKISQYYKKR